MKNKLTTDTNGAPRALGTATQTTPSSQRRAKRGGPAPAPGTREANQVAVAILDVLAGARLPAQAAAALGISLPRYYQLEQRALDAIVKACEPRTKGPPTNPERQRLKLERQVARLTQECSRQQALVRATQRTIGLAPPSPAKPTVAKDGSARKKRQRKPTVRALKAARNLRQTLDAQETSVAPSTAPSWPSDTRQTAPLSTVLQEGGTLS